MAALVEFQGMVAAGVWELVDPEVGKGRQIFYPRVVLKTKMLPATPA